MPRLFNGTSDFLDGGANVALAPPEFSISYWIKFNSLANAYTGMITRFNASNATIPFYAHFMKSNGKSAVYIANGSNSASYDGTGTQTITTSVWYHMFLLYSSALNACNTYVNGVLDGNFNPLAPFGGTSAADFTFGNDLLTAGRFLNGEMAEVAVWNVALSTLTQAPEIASLAQGARANTIRPQNLVGYWPLDGYSLPEPDYSGNKFSATNSGTSRGADGPPINLFTPQKRIYVAPQGGAPPSFNPYWAIPNNYVGGGGIAT